MGITEILFWILAAMTIFSAVMVITSKNPVYSVLWLIFTFFTISGHYILLNAQFLAIVNVRPHCDKKLWAWPINPPTCFDLE